MHKQSYFIINGITVYRIVAAPFLLILIFTGHYDIFKWLLAVSFFTDLIDGYLARRYKVNSILGSRLDSIGDDLTIVCALIGLFVFKSDFIKEEAIILLSLFSLYIIQTVLAFYKYGKITSFHTYLAKIAAILQGVFFVLIFFTKSDFLFLFYLAAVITAVELIEEIIIILFLKKWKANVKGLYWVMKDKITN